MSFDAHKNLVVTTVATPPSPATTGASLVVATGDGAKFPACPFNVTISPDPTGLTPLQIANASEIARCTLVTTDTLTLVRAQEGTTARTVVAGDIVAVAATAKSFTDIENALLSTAVADVGARVTRSSTQAISNATWTAVQFNFEDYDSGNLHDNTTNPTRVTVPYAGKYVCVGAVIFDASTSGTRYGALAVNGARVGQMPSSRDGAGGIVTVWSQDILNLNAGDYVEFHTYQDSGVSLNVEAGSRLSVLRVSAPAGQPGLVKLFDQTLTADTASIDTGAAGIPQTCDEIEVEILCRTDDAAAQAFPNIVVNNDTSTIYNRQKVAGNNASASAGQANTEANWTFTAHGSGGGAGFAAYARLVIPSYAEATFNKVGRLSTSTPDPTAANAVVEDWAVGYGSTNPISRLKLQAAGTAKLKAGTRVIIYGRPKEPVMPAGRKLYLSKPAGTITRASTAIGSFSTPWTIPNVVVGAGQNVRLKVSCQFYGGDVNDPLFAFVRGATQVTARIVYPHNRTFEMEWVDENPGAGTYTYEVQACQFVSGTLNVYQGNGATDSVSSGGSIFIAEVYTP